MTGSIDRKLTVTNAAQDLGIPAKQTKFKLLLEALLKLPALTKGTFLISGTNAAIATPAIGLICYVAAASTGECGGLSECVVAQIFGARSLRV